MAGYGCAAFGNRFTSTPEVGFGLGNTGREFSLGWLRVPAGGGFPIAGQSFDSSVVASRFEAANEESPLEHEVGWQLNSRRQARMPAADLHLPRELRWVRSQFLTTDEAAGIVGMTPRTLAAYRQTGRGPFYLKLGSAVRYRLQDLEAWVASRGTRPGSISRFSNGAPERHGSKR